MSIFPSRYQQYESRWPTRMLINNKFSLKMAAKYYSVCMYVRNDVKSCNIYKKRESTKFRSLELKSSLNSSLTKWFL